MAVLTPREQMIYDVKLRLGHGMIDIELDPEHIDFALRAAFDTYRQRSDNGMQEAFCFLDVQPDVASYTLPSEIQEVRSVYRRTLGGTSGGASIDPFSLAFTNSIYMIQNPGGLGGGGGAGTLATYDFAMQYQSLVGRMFGRDVLFTWDASTKRLTLHRRFGGVEQVGLHVWNAKPDDVILGDPYAKPWIRSYTVAQCKLMIGEARSLFSSIGGPQGGVSLNGEAVKTEALTEIEKLETQLTQYVEQHGGSPFLIG